MYVSNSLWCHAYHVMEHLFGDIQYLSKTSHYIFWLDPSRVRIPTTNIWSEHPTELPLSDSSKHKRTSRYDKVPYPSKILVCENKSLTKPIFYLRCLFREGNSNLACAVNDVTNMNNLFRPNPAVFVIRNIVLLAPTRFQEKKHLGTRQLYQYIVQKLKFLQATEALDHTYSTDAFQASARLQRHPTIHTSQIPSTSLLHTSAYLNIVQIASTAFLLT